MKNLKGQKTKEIQNNLSTYINSLRKEETNFLGYESFLNKIKENKNPYKEECFNKNDVYDSQEEFYFEKFSEEGRLEDYKKQNELDVCKLSLYKEHEEYAAKIFQLSNGYFVNHIIFQNISSEKIDSKNNKNNSGVFIQIKTIKSKNQIIIKSRYYSPEPVSKKIDVNTSEPFISEINENGKIYAIVSEETHFYAITFKNDVAEQKRYEIENIFIYQILQKDEKEYIVSCNKGTYVYKGSILIHYLNTYLKEDDKIYNVGFKKGILLSKRYIAFIDNSKEDIKGNIIIYDLISRKKFLKLIDNKMPLNEKTFSLIDWKKTTENKKDGNKKVLLCSCKEDNKMGGLLIKFNSGEPKEDKFIEHFFQINNFIIEHICPLKYFKEEVNISDSNYIIITGKALGNTEIRLYELEDNESECFPTIEWVKTFEIYDISIFSEISFIIHSITKGNLIIGFINENTKEFNFELDK